METWTIPAGDATSQRVIGEFQAALGRSLDTIDSLEERVRELGALRDHFFDQAQRFDHDFNVQMARAEGAEARIALLEKVVEAGRPLEKYLSLIEGRTAVPHALSSRDIRHFLDCLAALDQKGEQG